MSRWYLLTNLLLNCLHSQGCRCSQPEAHSLLITKILISLKKTSVSITHGRSPEMTQALCHPHLPCTIYTYPCLGYLSCVLSEVFITHPTVNTRQQVEQDINCTYNFPVLHPYKHELKSTGAEEWVRTRLTKVAALKSSTLPCLLGHSNAFGIGRGG